MRIDPALLLASHFQGKLGSNLYHRHQEVVHALVQAGAELENTEGAFRPLAYAAYSNPPGIVTYLIQQGALINGDALNGQSNHNTPLMMAAINGSHEATVALLRLGADTTITKGSGPKTETALFFAEKYKHLKIVSYILCAQSLKAGERFQDVCE